MDAKPNHSSRLHGRRRYHRLITRILSSGTGTQSTRTFTAAGDQGSRRKRRANVVDQPYDDGLTTNRKYSLSKISAGEFVPKRQSKDLTAIFTEDPDAVLRAQKLL